jgi:acyl-coenzyme A thioesterase PaaI-like protein
MKTKEVGMEQRAFQDHYPDDVSHCYGCGRLNDHGLKLKSRWDGKQSVATVIPRPYHTAIPGFVYGGFIASVIDCHGTGTAAAAAYRAEDRSMDSEPALRFVTASLRVDYLKPIPLGVPLELRGTILSATGKKVTTAITVTANNEACARGEVVAVLMPPHMISAVAMGRA